MTTKASIDEPAIYHIQVWGQLDQKWVDWFDGFTITPINGETLLTGLITDQAALHGILAKIRDLGLSIISVRRAEKNNIS
jgi:hypothetical protein